MTETTTGTTTGTTQSKAKAPADALSTSALSEVGQRLLGLVVQRAAEAATERVSALSDRLASVSDQGGQGLAAALLGGDGEDGGSATGALGKGLSKAKEMLGGGGGGGGGKNLKVTNIVEDIDVGLPLRTTYNLWTQYADFPSFMKKVESVEQEAEETTNWKAQVLWSHRTWEATIVEQVPDSHIVWRSKGAKGHVDGVVTFTELGRNLTRVLFVLEYHPQGFFEYTGNIWRAQGRRARLEIKHFRRHAMSTVLLDQQKVEGWRGEIRDGEVVKTHEEALEEEAAAAEEPGAPDEEYDEAEGYDEGAAEGYEGEEDEAEEDESAGHEDEYSDEDEYDDEYEDEPVQDEDVAEEDLAEEDVAEEDVAEEEPEPEPTPSRRGGRRGGRR